MGRHAESPVQGVTVDSFLEFGLYALFFLAALIYFFRFKNRQRTEDDRDDLRSLVLRTDRSPEEARRVVRRYASQAKWLVEAEETGELLVLASSPSPLQPGYFFRIQLREEPGETRGTRLDIGVRSRVAFYLAHPFVDGKVDRLAEGLLEELDPAVRVS